MIWRALLWLLPGLWLLTPYPLWAVEHGVILLYHRVSESGPGSTRVSPETFASHLDLIAQGGYQVLPLDELLQGIYGDGEIPERAVAITFDDAYRSVGEAAYPMLRERAMPFSVFVATDVVDEGGSGFLTWDAMREMAASGLVTFGPHSISHAHLESLGGTGAQGLSAEREAEIDGSLARLREELAEAVVDAFAYPFGEYSLNTEALLRQRGLYGLAQQSGAVGGDTPSTRIPRFPFYTGGDSSDRLQTALASRPLMMEEEGPAEVFIANEATVPAVLRVRPLDDAYRSDGLSCFSAAGERLVQRWDDDWLELSLPTMKPGRNKVNCTAPANDGSGYYWFSRLWIWEDADGRWLRH